MGDGQQICAVESQSGLQRWERVMLVLLVLMSFMKEYKDVGPGINYPEMASRCLELHNQKLFRATDAIILYTVSTR